MVQQIINVDQPNTKQGTPARDAFIMVNENFEEIYASVTSLAATDVVVDSRLLALEAFDPTVTAALALKAPLASPALTGNPTAPTPAAADNDTSIATTAFVQGEIAAKAPLASPALTGNPTAPTPSPGDNDTSIATTAFVDTSFAKKASPVFTGDPQAPTPATGDNDTSIATTAFVKNQAYATIASPTLTGNPTAPTASGGDNDTSIATTAFVQGEIAAKAPLASPALTGNPTAPTPTAGDNDTSIATTAFVQAALGFALTPVGAVIDYAGSTAPSGWIFLRGQTIGSAASGATHAAAGYSTLYTLLWNSMANAQAPVSGGRGASAAADFAANKTLTIPDARGRTSVGLDNMGGTSANRLTGLSGGVDGDILGNSGGAESHALVIAELANHDHNVNTQNSPSGDGGALSTRRAGAISGNMGAITTAGSGNAHNNVQPALVLSKIIYAGV